MSIASNRVAPGEARPEPGRHMPAAALGPGPAGRHGPALAAAPPTLRGDLRVFEVMHRNVATVRPESSFQEIARLLVSRRVSAVPVVDRERHVLGVVSAEDLLTTKASPFRYSQRASRVAPGRAAGQTAGELMSRPALTIGPEATIGRAADLMHVRHVKRLPVVDEERRLLGIVARSDLLEVMLRRVPETDA